MGTTTNYAWPYPELGDAPNVPADVKALADASDTDVKAIDNRLTTAETDIGNLEADTRYGWTFIGGGSVASGDFLIDLTAAGKYPAGTFRTIRIFIEGEFTSGNDLLLGRVNSDATTDLYNRGWISRRFETGVIENNGSSSGTSYVIGRWSGLPGNNTEITLFTTHVSSELGMRAVGNRSGAGTFNGNREEFHAHGTLQSNRLINSFEIRAPATLTLSTSDWHAEGFLLP